MDSGLEGNCSKEKTQEEANTIHILNWLLLDEGKRDKLTVFRKKKKTTTTKKQQPFLWNIAFLSTQNKKDVQLLNTNILITGKMTEIITKTGENHESGQFFLGLLSEKSDSAGSLSHSCLQF